MATGEAIFSQGRLGVGRTEQLSTLTVKARASFDLTGTVAKTNASVTVTGTGTAFLSELGPGDLITIPGGASETRTVVAIASDSSLTVDRDFTNSSSGETATVLPSAARIDDSSDATLVTVSGEGHVGIGTTCPNLDPRTGTGPLLRLHAADASLPWLLVFSNSDADSGGMALWLQGQGRLLTFNEIDKAGDGPEILHVGGPDEGGIGILTGIRFQDKVVDNNYTVTRADTILYVDAGSGGVTVTLSPSAAGGGTYHVIKVAGAGDVTVSPDGSDTINGANASKTISTLWDGLLVNSFGSGWVASILTGA